MGFWVMALISVGVTVISSLLRPRPPRAIAADVRPEKFSGVTAEEGRPIPVFCGTRRLDSANLVWFGDLSQVAIVQSGVTTGYKYYMGGQYVLCIGPLDAIQDVQFNKVPVGSTVTTTNRTLVVRVGGGDVNADVALGNYGSRAALALAVEQALRSATGRKWKVTGSFVVEGGRNDTIVFAIQRSGVLEKFSAHVTPGMWSTAAFSIILEAAMNNALTGEAEDGQFTVDYNTAFAPNGFTITYDGDLVFGYEGWRVLASDDDTFDHETTIRNTIGMHLYDAKISDANDRVNSDFAVLINRFIIGYESIGGTIRAAAAAFTAETLLGLNAVDVGVGSKMTDSDYTPTAATFTETTDYLQVVVSDPDIFGTEGGVEGTLKVYRGLLTQAESAYLTAQFGVTAPAYRGVVHMVQEGMYIGNTNYPKQPSITGSRWPNGLGVPNGEHVIGQDSNPACWLYELLTDTIWGLGIATGQIDQASFLAAAATLYAEGFGISYNLDAITSGGDVIEDVMKHIDGGVYVDQVSGLIAMKLARNDYDINSVLEISPANGRDLRVSRVSWEQTRNAVKVRYTDREKGYTERVVQRHNLANIQSRDGDMAIEEFVAQGIMTEALAIRVAERELGSLSEPTAQITVSVDRSAWSLRPVGAFALTWPRLGITKMPCRVVRVIGGSLEDGRIGIEAVQDTVGPEWTGFVAPVADAEDPVEVLTIAPGQAASDAGLVGDIPVGTI